MAEDQSPPRPPQGPRNLNAQGDDVGKYLNRDDIRTMGKDVARLREEEAQKEREHIAKMQTEKEEVKEKEMAENIRKIAVERKEQQKSETEAREKREAQERARIQQAKAEREKREAEAARAKEKKDDTTHVKQQMSHHTISPDSSSRPSGTPPQPQGPPHSTPLPGSPKPHSPAGGLPQTPHPSAPPLRPSITKTPIEDTPPRSPNTPAHLGGRPSVTGSPHQRSATPTKPPPIQGIPHHKPERGPSSRSRIFVRLFIIIFIAFVIFNALLFGYKSLSDQDINISLPSIFSNIPFISPQESPSPLPTGGPSPSPTTTETPSASPSPTPLPTETPSSPPVGGPSPTDTAPPVPPSLLLGMLDVSQVFTLQFANQNELMALFSTLKSETQSPGFAHLILQHKGQEETLTPEGFFAIFGAAAPQGLLDELGDDSVFFLFTDSYGNRLGFVSEIDNTQAAKGALLQWESSLETSIGAFSSFWGLKGDGYTSLFREVAHEDIPIRFQTFSLQDTGIVYAIVDNYLVFASTFEGTKALIDKLQ